MTGKSGRYGLFSKKSKKNPHLRLIIIPSFSKIALRIRDAGVAQLVEQLTCNQPVGGSTPLASSISKAKLLILLAIYFWLYIVLNV